MLLKRIVKGIYQWLFFFFPALTLAGIGLIPTLRARKSRVLMCTLGFASLGFLTETWLQAHYVAVAAGILYLILLNGLRWMRVSARHRRDLAKVAARHAGGGYGYVLRPVDSGADEYFAV